MKIRIRATAMLGLPGVVACCLLLSPAVATAGTVSPLPTSDYTVRPVCATPAPRRAGCLAPELVPSTAAARAHTHPLGTTRNNPVRSSEATEGVFGLSPQDLHSAYQLPTAAPSAQTIAIIDAYDDPHAEVDLAAYDAEFHLPPCTKANGCFEQLNQKGESGNLPVATSEKEQEEAAGWAVEISTDIEAAHAICQELCRIVLLETNSPQFSDLEEAEETAAQPLDAGGLVGATEISNSWGGSECVNGPGGVECGEESPAFNHAGIVITAAAGDNGYLDWGSEHEKERGFPDYPASSPHVIAVGGTRLTLHGIGGTRASETVWNGDGATGGGCSTVFTAQPWQQDLVNWQSVGCPTDHRAVADVSADADPYTGVAVYDSQPDKEGATWRPIGGTSVAAPIVASVFALAGGAHGVSYPAKTLYENLADSPTSLHDVRSGSNGKCEAENLFDKATGLSDCEESFESADCSGQLICNAGTGYDGPTGVGAPDGITAFKPFDEEAKRQTEEKQREEKLREEELREKEQRAEEQQREEKREAEELGVGSSGGSTTGASGKIEAGASAIPGAGQAAGLAGGKAGEKESSSTLTIKLSAFALTPRALLALNRAQPEISEVSFAFTLSATTRVRVTLAKRIRVRGRDRWEFVPAARTFTAAKGRNRRRLTNSDALTPGRYRLTLVPAHGNPRSLVFLIG